MKFTPSRFCDFKGLRRFDGADAVGIGVMEFESYFAEPVREWGGRGDGSDVDGPLMRMVCVNVWGTGGGIEDFGYGTEDWERIRQGIGGWEMR